jgi:hypothetical protein
MHGTAVGKKIGTYFVKNSYLYWNETSLKLSPYRIQYFLSINNVSIPDYILYRMTSNAELEGLWQGVLFCFISNSVVSRSDRLTLLP